MSYYDINRMAQATGIEPGTPSEETKAGTGPGCPSDAGEWPGSGHGGDGGEHVALDSKLVRVTRPSIKNSVAQGVAGMAESTKARGTGSIAPELYILTPVEDADILKVAGLLFTEEELEPLQ